ncbi:MAG: mechanosensitive ion channel, partial [Gammaproteobacteria bacterium]|nr:mechanosensitive ion channel [Gammaproteobacteria bacterium]
MRWYPRSIELICAKNYCGRRARPPIDFDDLGDFARTGLAVLNPLHWWDVWRAAIEAPSLRPGRLVIGVLLILAAILLARGARQRLHDIVDPMRRIRTDSFRYTLYALFQTVFIALPVSLSMAVLGWSLQGAENRVVDALGHGFIATAAFALTLRVLQAVLVDEGLAQSHFRWPDQVRRPLRAVSIWLLWCGVPLVLAIETLTVLGDAELTTGLARPAFVLWMILITASLWRLLRPSGSVSRRLAESSLQMMAHTRFLWVPAVLATPLALAALSLLGYHHTALEFGSRLVTSLWVLIGVLIGRSLLLRSFYVVERRLRFDDALKRREEARALRQSDDNAAEAEFGAMPDEPEVDYQDLGEQARRLVDISTLVLGVVGIWFVWSDLVPALRVLDNVHLPLSATDIVDGVEKEVPVTLSDVVFALGALFMTLFAAKNLTGLLEIVLLQRLPLDTGGRYAIATLSKYAIVAIGLVVTLNAIGLDWSNIQWLVAALSVGLGFGLQEIVANFISGIILLVERPIRPGDVVTIGDTVGTVARIRIRATTVVNYDRQELLVPNKEF